MKKSNISKMSAILLTSLINLNLCATEETTVTPLAQEVQPVTQIVQEEQTVTQEVQTPASKKTSRKKSADKLKQETFRLGQATCIFCTAGKDPYIKVVRPEIDELKIIKCGKLLSETTNGKVKTPADLEKLAPLSITTLNYASNTKSVIKYRGDREAIIGKALEIILLPLETYKGTLLVDEYKENIPMFWVLKNTDELKAIKNYFSTKLGSDFVPAQKTLLVIKINGDPKLEKLDNECQEFLTKYFQVYPLTDADVKAFFEKNMELINSTSFDMEGSNPLYVGENIRQSVFRQIEKGYKKFDSKDIAIITCVTLFGTFVLKQIDREVDDVSKTIFRGKTLVGTIKEYGPIAYNKVVGYFKPKTNPE